MKNNIVKIIIYIFSLIFILVNVPLYAFVFIYNNNIDKYDSFWTYIPDIVGFILDSAYFIIETVPWIIIIVIILMIYDIIKDLKLKTFKIRTLRFYIIILILFGLRFYCNYRFNNTLDLIN